MASKLANFSQHGLSAGSQPWVSDTSILSKHAPRLHRSDTDLFALLLKHDLIARFKAQSMTHRFGHRDLSFAGYPCLSLHCNLQFLTLARRSLLFQRAYFLGTSSFRIKWEDYTHVFASRHVGAPDSDRQSVERANNYWYKTRLVLIPDNSARPLRTC